MNTCKHCKKKYELDVETMTGADCILCPNCQTTENVEKYTQQPRRRNQRKISSVLPRTFMVPSSIAKTNAIIQQKEEAYIKKEEKLKSDIHERKWEEDMEHEINAYYNEEY